MCSDEELRLECLRLAISRMADDPIAEAQRMFDYIRGVDKPAAVRCDQD